MSSCVELQELLGQCSWAEGGIVGVSHARPGAALRWSLWIPSNSWNSSKTAAHIKGHRKSCPSHSERAKSKREHEWCSRFCITDTKSDRTLQLGRQRLGLNPKSRPTTPTDFQRERCRGPVKKVLLFLLTFWKRPHPIFPQPARNSNKLQQHMVAQGQRCRIPGSSRLENPPGPPNPTCDWSHPVPQTGAWGATSRCAHGTRQGASGSSPQEAMLWAAGLLRLNFELLSAKLTCFKPPTRLSTSSFKQSYETSLCVPSTPPHFAGSPWTTTVDLSTS